jgi:hypothetical protein
LLGRPTPRIHKQVVIARLRQPHALPPRAISITGDAEELGACLDDGMNPNVVIRECQRLRDKVARARVDRFGNYCTDRDGGTRRTCEQQYRHHEGMVHVVTLGPSA